MLGAYILMFPQARVNVLVGSQVVAMPALIVLGFWIVLQLFSGVGSIAYTDESTRIWAASPIWRTSAASWPGF